MSEYQYYEFAAVDRPLTRNEMAELRAVSTRATITPNSFTNEYDWGDLKADPADWMHRYFDAFVYSANWFTCQLSLRLPRAVLCHGELEAFTGSAALSVLSSDSNWIISWMQEDSQDDERFAANDGEGWMRRLLPLRDELMRGDVRPLYLGWLAGIDSWPDDMLEPEPPDGLAELSPAQQALAEFLDISPDLLEAAGFGTASVASSQQETPQLSAWLASWPNADMQNMIKAIALGQAHEAERQVKSRYAAWLKAQRPTFPQVPRRQVGELRERLDSVASARRAREAEALAQRQARLRQQREAELRRIMETPEIYWHAADAEASRANASGYEKSVSLLAALAQGYALVSTQQEFEQRLRRFLVPHAKRPALLRRLVDTGLWSE